MTQQNHYNVALPDSKWKTEIGGLIEETFNRDGKLTREVGIKILAKYIEKINKDCLDKIEKITANSDTLSEEDFKIAHAAACRLEDVDKDIQKANTLYTRHEFAPYIESLNSKDLNDQLEFMACLKQLCRTIQVLE